MSSPACFWMAATTSGWQWPVDGTAMPAEKSTNSLPSTSVTTIPRPLLPTSGYERVYDGEIYFWSASSTRLALGPGRAVFILGPIVAVMVLVVMGSSERQWPVVSKCNLGTRGPVSSARRTETVGRRMRVSRYRRGWGASGKASSPDSAAGTQGSAASTRVDANWDGCATLLGANITDSL